MNHKNPLISFINDKKLCPNLQIIFLKWYCYKPLDNLLPSHECHLETDP